jgi:hypothetical protein
MKNLRAYISCPISVPINNLNQVISVAIKEYKYVNWWIRNGPYDKDVLLQADVVIIVLPNNCFQYSVENLPIGVEKEYETAKFYNKHIILSYFRSSDQSVQFYKINETNNTDYGTHRRIINSIIGSAHTEYPDTLIPKKTIADVTVHMEGMRRLAKLQSELTNKYELGSINIQKVKIYDRRLLIT